jgi:hypothetical protein
MTSGNGFPSGMDRFALDAGTAEGLISGAVDVGDAPPEYRAVAVVLQALREPPESWELVGGPAVAERIAATVVTARTERAPTRPRRFASCTRVAMASLVALGLALSGGGLASAGALPEPAQRAASAVLSKVGISVPTGDDEPVDHRSVPPAVPKPAAAAPVQSNPTTAAPSAPAPVPHNAGEPAPVGSGQEDGRAPPAGDSSEPTPPANGDGPTPPGNGNAFGHTKAVASANGNGNGNGHGNGNAYAYGKAQAAGNTKSDRSVDGSLAPASASP